MDNANYDYPTVDGIANVVFETPKGATHPIYRICPHVHPVIKRLATSRPGWMLVGQRAGITSTASERMVYTFQVWEGDEQIGHIEREYRGSAYCYGITNRRIREEMTRGQVRYTKDVDKALKLIYRTFYSKSPVEAMGDAKKQLSSKIGQELASRAMMWTQAKQFATTAVDEILLENWEEVVARTKSINPGASRASDIEKAPDIFRERQEYTELLNTYNTQQGTTVMLQGDKYVVLKPSVSEGVLTVDTLTDELRMAVGMLKLVEDGKHIPGVGYRLTATVYFIT